MNNVEKAVYNEINRYAHRELGIEVYAERYQGSFDIDCPDGMNCKQSLQILELVQENADEGDVELLLHFLVSETEIAKEIVSHIVDQDIAISASYDEDRKEWELDVKDRPSVSEGKDLLSAVTRISKGKRVEVGISIMIKKMGQLLRLKRS